MYVGIGATHPQRGDMADAVVPLQELEYIPPRIASKAVEPATSLRSVSIVIVNCHAWIAVIVEGTTTNIVVPASGQSNIVTNHLNDAGIVFHPISIPVESHYATSL
jgi:hypothetical protein